MRWKKNTGSESTKCIEIGESKLSANATEMACSICPLWDEIRRCSAYSPNTFLIAAVSTAPFLGGEIPRGRRCSQLTQGTVIFKRVYSCSLKKTASFSGTSSLSYRVVARDLLPSKPDVGRAGVSPERVECPDLTYMQGNLPKELFWVT